MEESTDNDRSDHSSAYHVPVLFTETMEALADISQMVFMSIVRLVAADIARGILDKLGANGKLVAFDQDADASKQYSCTMNGWCLYRTISPPAKVFAVEWNAKVDGVLADLGVSSHQFDEGERGFSTRFEGPLDMRMDQRQDLTASTYCKKIQRTAIAQDV